MRHSSLVIYLRNVTIVPSRVRRARRGSAPAAAQDQQEQQQRSGNGREALGHRTAGDALLISSSRHLANWSISFAATSAITPRPNCAGLPVTLRSVRTCTFVVEPSPTSCAVTVAPAVPLPRDSLPLASMTARCAASSLLAKRASPL